MSKHFSLIIIKYTTFTLQLIEYKSLWNNRKYILFTNTTMQIIHTQQSCTCTRFIRGTCLNWQIRYIFIKKKVVWPCSHLNNIEETLIPISGQTTNINLWVFFHRKYQIVITFAVYSLINIFSYHSLYIGTQTVEMYIFYSINYEYPELIKIQYVTSMITDLNKGMLIKIGKLFIFKFFYFHINTTLFKL